MTKCLKKEQKKLKSITEKRKSSCIVNSAKANYVYTEFKKTMEIAPRISIMRTTITTKRPLQNFRVKLGYSPIPS